MSLRLVAPSLLIDREFVVWRDPDAAPCTSIPASSLPSDDGSTPAPHRGAVPEPPAEFGCVDEPLLRQSFVVRAFSDRRKPGKDRFGKTAATSEVRNVGGEGVYWCNRPYVVLACSRKTSCACCLVSCSDRQASTGMRR